MKQKYLDAYVDMMLRFAQTSESSRQKVGACLLKHGNPIAYGVNGTIAGWSTNNPDNEDGTTNHKYARHAEINALNKLRRLSIGADGCTLLVTLAPCLPCAHELVDAGIVEVIYLEEFKDRSGIDYLTKMGVKCERYNSGGIEVDRNHSGGSGCGCNHHSDSDSHP